MVKYIEFSQRRNKIKYFSLFSGIGAFEKALVNQEIPFELVGYSEIDKYASKSYSQIHGVPELMNYGDITKIDETKLPEIDFITYGFPCQDISVAGKQKGFLNEDGTKTRSGLFFDALRIIEHTQPKVAIAENVKNLVGNKFKEQFEIVLESLEDAGYNNYWKVLNAKDYGIPQNRERVFIVSIRKDVDNKRFQFPEPYELTLILKDMLEDKVDEKYYLSDEIQKRFVLTDKTLTKSIIGTTKPNFKTIGQRDLVYQENSVIGSLMASDYKQPKQILTLNSYDGENLKPHRIGGIYDTDKSKHQAGSVWDSNSISPTIDTMQGGNRQPCVIVLEKNQKGYKKDFVGVRIRKLTPKECFRLMGFYDEDFEKCSCSNTQLYKQAGNSIVVDVAEEILCMMFDEKGNFFI